MFNFPKDFKWAEAHSKLLLSAHQSCIECGQWFSIPVTDVQYVLDYGANHPSESGIPMTWCVCDSCCHRQLILLPGKYESLHAKYFSQQRYVFQKE